MDRGERGEVVTVILSEAKDLIAVAAGEGPLIGIAKGPSLRSG